MKTFSREIYDKANRVKMTDYLKIYEKFKDVKEVKDYIDDVILLRHYYATQQYSQMQDHIRKLMNKHLVETLAWNAVNSSQPTTIEQSYINAEHFLQMQGAKTITKTVKNYAQRLSKEEIEFVKSLEVIRN
ncbi:MAG: hypothetical protein IKK77_01460 [Clostridia bacterium]|nr:hypothetical protein [Clostridia bacterium]